MRFMPAAFNLARADDDERRRIVFQFLQRIGGLFQARFEHLKAA
jgi:hypothetical protein